MNKDFKLRVIYGVVTVFLLVIEVLIALYIHDSFVRPYIGDVLIVILLYTFARIWIPKKYGFLPLWIFLFAAAVEGLQYFKLVELLGLQNNVFMRTLMGSVFDVKDIICYAAGCMILGVYELIKRKNWKPAKDRD